MFPPPNPSPKESLAGSLLLAHPVLRDPNFRRTAVLLSSHDSEGAMGVVLNRPLQKKLRDFGMDFALGALADIPVFDGGPVARRQLILCAWRPHDPDEDRDTGDDTDGDEASDGGVQLLFGLDANQATDLCGQPGVEIRAFLGHAGWSSGQLEGELKQETWVVTELEPDAIYSRPDEALWKRILGGINPHWRLLAGEPDDPGLN